MAKKIVRKKLPALELKHPKFDVNIKLPMKVRLENVEWNRFMPKTNQVLGILLVIAAFLIGVLFTKVQYLEKSQAGNNNQQAAAIAPAGQQQAAAPTPGAKVDVAVGNLPAKGDANAKVTIIEFADFRCPFCEQFYSNTEPQIVKDYVDTGKAKLVFRNFAFLGAASVTAADAAECANDQGKFWDYFDYLYKNQPAETDTTMYNTDTLTQAAVSLGMDSNTFSSCLNNKTDEAKVNADMADGQKAGISGTPSFVINGTLLVGAQPYSAFQTAIDQALAQAK